VLCGTLQNGTPSLGVTSPETFEEMRRWPPRRLRELALMEEALDGKDVVIPDCLMDVLDSERPLCLELTLLSPRADWKAPPDDGLSVTRLSVVWDRQGEEPPANVELCISQRLPCLETVELRGGPKEEWSNPLYTGLFGASGPALRSVTLKSLTLGRALTALLCGAIRQRLIHSLTELVIDEVAATPLELSTIAAALVGTRCLQRLHLVADSDSQGPVDCQHLTVNQLLTGNESLTDLRIHGFDNLALEVEPSPIWPTLCRPIRVRHYHRCICTTQ
jgi:hypothetical protein